MMRSLTQALNEEDGAPISKTMDGIINEDTRIIAQNKNSVLESVVDKIINEKMDEIVQKVIEKINQKGSN